MALKLISPFLLSHPSPLFSSSFNHKNLFILFLKKNLEASSLISSSSSSKIPAIGGPRASVSGTPRNDVAGEDEKSSSSRSLELNDEFISRVWMMKDAGEVLEMIATTSAGMSTRNGGGVVSSTDCCRIICSALQRNNSDLALSVFAAMRSSSFDRGSKENGGFVENWKWSRPDLRIYTALVLGLAASLRVSDALKMVSEICRVGASPGEEVPFGKVVRCPTCMIAVTVAQPQQGIQIVSCAKCRYQYELISGDVINIESEEIRISSCRTQRGCSSLEKVAGISASDEANDTISRPFHCDPNPFWGCSYS